MRILPIDQKRTARGHAAVSTVKAALLDFLFFAAVVFAFLLSARICAAAIVVDGSGTGDYETVQEAIEVAAAGDTIVVRPGVYEETGIIIDTTVTLSGDNESSTVIHGDGTGSVLVVNADGVTVSGLTIADGGEMIHGTVSLTADNCRITGNIITGSDDVGIVSHGSTNNIIEKNVITGFSFAGIWFSGNEHSNTIVNNRISDCLAGIYLFNSQDQIIEQNVISECSRAILIEESNENTVRNNQFYSNGQGVHISYGADNLITENNFISNEEHAKFSTWLAPDGLQISTWEANYWDGSCGFFPQWIPGILFIKADDFSGLFLPWGSIDWHPAGEPYGPGAGQSHGHVY